MSALHYLRHWHLQAVACSKHLSSVGGAAFSPHARSSASRGSRYCCDRSFQSFPSLPTYRFRWPSFVLLHHTTTSIGRKGADKLDRHTNIALAKTFTVQTASWLRRLPFRCRDDNRRSSSSAIQPLLLPTLRDERPWQQPIILVCSTTKGLTILPHIRFSNPERPVMPERPVGRSCEGFGVMGKGVSSILG